MASVLRVALPMAALVLMSMVFLLSRNVDPYEAVALADIDLASVTQDPRATGPRLSGMTDDGVALELRADAARSVSGAQAILELSHPAGILEATSPDAEWQARFSAVRGILDRQANHLTFVGDVEVTTSGGYVLQVPQLRATLDRTLVEGTGGVDGSGPAGTLQAAAFTLTQSHHAEGDYLLEFRGGVRIVYQPPRTEEER